MKSYKAATTARRIAEHTSYQSHVFVGKREQPPYTRPSLWANGPHPPRPSVGAKMALRANAPNAPQPQRRQRHHAFDRTSKREYIVHYLNQVSFE